MKTIGKTLLVLLTLLLVAGGFEAYNQHVRMSRIDEMRTPESRKAALPEAKEAALRDIMQGRGGVGSESFERMYRLEKALKEDAAKANIEPMRPGIMPDEKLPGIMPGEKLVKEDEARVEAVRQNEAAKARIAEDARREAQKRQAAAEAAADAPRLRAEAEEAKRRAALKEIAEKYSKQSK